MYAQTVDANLFPVVASNHLNVGIFKEVLFPHSPTATRADVLAIRQDGHVSIPAPKIKLNNSNCTSYFCAMQELFSISLLACEIFGEPDRDRTCYLEVRSFAL